MLAMLYTTLPLWSVTLEWLLGERPPLWVMCGLALACSGIVLLMNNGLDQSASAEQWFSGLLVVFATLLWAGGAWLLRQRPPFRSSWLGLSLQMLIGALLLGLFGLWHGDWQALDLHSLSQQSWLWLAYLVLPVSLGVYPAYFWLLREVRPSLVSTFAFVNPVVALLLGYWLLDEHLSLLAMLACGITLGGVVLIIFGRR
jgi:drug/metabolite transporter (DMT)-like permease